MHRVRITGLDLEFASHALQNDRGIVLEAIQQDSSAFQYASDALRKDEEFILQAMNTMAKCSFLEFMDPSLKDDLEFMLKVVQCRGSAIRWASPWLTKHWSLVLEALKKPDIKVQDINASFWLYPEHVQQALVHHPGWKIYFKV